jgi:hypothetical protein
MRFDAPVPDDKRKQAEPAWVYSNLKQGSILLVGPDGDVALDWKQDDKERVRGIPPGKYRLRTVRVERLEKQVHWFISATSPPRKPMQLRSDKKTTLKVSDTVHFAGRVKRKGKQQLQLGFVIQADDRSGLSIYRAGKRVPVHYRVLSRKGRALASGKMNYG